MKCCELIPPKVLIVSGKKEPLNHKTVRGFNREVELLSRLGKWKLKCLVLCAGEVLYSANNLLC